MDVEVFATERLAEVDGLTSDPADREHVSLYFHEHPERFDVLSVEAERPWPDLRLTVDTPEDLALVTAVFEALHPRDPAFGLPEVVALLESRPDLAALNRHVEQKPVR
jgi:spore coat polysaccharide biosynthesis protein SpsF